DDDDDEERIVAEVLVRKCLTDDQHFLEIRVAIVGGADAGKSTLLGVLAHSELDNGRGKSRLNLLRHPHEFTTGRTSSISHQIIGFNPRGDLVNYGSTNISTWEQICENASKVVTFLDMCGHPKYQRTTISGLTGHAPDFACLILGANAGGVSEVPREHLGLAVALTVPVFVVITKIDVANSDQLGRTVSSLLGLLKSPGIRRVPMVIENEDDLVVAVSSLLSSRVIPIFLTSSVTGANMNLLVKFLNLLPKPSKQDDETESSDEVEYCIEETYTVPSVGCVVGGMMVSGTISVHSGRKMTYYLGPDRGRFIPVRISSVHRQRCPVNHLATGQAATCALTFLSRSDANGDSKESLGSGDELDFEETSVPPAGFKIRKGQVILSVKPSGGAVSGGGNMVAESPSIRGGFLTGSPIADSPYFLPSSPNSLSVAGQLSMTPLSLNGNGSSSIPLSSGSVWEFEADLHVLAAPAAGVAIAAQGCVYLGNVRQGARIVKLKDDAGRWASISLNLLPNGTSGRSSPRRRSVSPAGNATGTGGSQGGLVMDNEMEGGKSGENNIGSVNPASPRFKPKRWSAGVGQPGSRSPQLTGRDSPIVVEGLVVAASPLKTQSSSSDDSLNSNESLKTDGNERRETLRKTASPGVSNPPVSPSLRPTTPSYISSPSRRPRSLSINASALSANVSGSDPLPTLSTAARGKVRFRFLYEPEWVHVGATVVFRGEGRTKCVGKVVSIVEGAGAVGGSGGGEKMGGDIQVGVVSGGGSGSGERSNVDFR
ncbi:Short integuments 2, mitochondrial, partial [Blyttiomyces sp. JEL0837]